MTSPARSAPAGPFTAYRALRPGATMAIVAPSGPSSEASAQATPGFIAAQGWRARMMPSTEARGGYLAGADAQRAADLIAAYTDPEVDALWCIRGGYGAGRLLPLLPPQLAQAHPKPLLGYSDITVLHAWAVAQGQLSLHSPMPGSELVNPQRAGDAAAITGWLREGLVNGAVLRREVGHAAGGATADGAAAAAATRDERLRVGGRVRGRLMGGNLCLLAALAGTPWAPDYRGAIVFIEEVGEEPYRVDRMLLQLQQSGALAAAAGFVIGSFTGADYPEDELYRGLAAMGKPLVANWPSGHGTPNRPLPLGAMVTLDADAAELHLHQDVILPPG